MAKGSERTGLLERATILDRDINAGIGVFAFADFLFTGSIGAETLATLELIHVLVLNGLRNFIDKRRADGLQSA